MSKENICIYHADCADGFTAAWVVYKALGINNCEFYPAKYNEAPPLVDFKNVYIVDFSYSREVIAKMALSAKRITILDHHKTAIENLTSIEGSEYLELYKNKLELVLDKNRSGAKIAWDYFFPTIQAPLALLAVQDRDLWLFNKLDTHQITSAIFSYHYTFDKWDVLMNDGEIEFLKSEGTALLRKQERDVVQTADLTITRLYIDGFSVPCCNVPPFLASDTGHYLLENNQETKFSATFYFKNGNFVFSLRSTDDRVDVSLIAKKYGGGGHRNAAGFQIPIDRSDKDFYFEVIFGNHHMAIVQKSIHEDRDE